MKNLWGPAMMALALLFSGGARAQSFSAKTLLIPTAVGARYGNSSAGIRLAAGHPRWMNRNPLARQYRGAVGRNRKCHQGLRRMSRNRHYLPGIRGW